MQCVIIRSIRETWRDDIKDVTVLTADCFNKGFYTVPMDMNTGKRLKIG